MNISGPCSHVPHLLNVLQGSQATCDHAAAACLTLATFHGNEDVLERVQPSGCPKLHSQGKASVCRSNIMQSVQSEVGGVTLRYWTAKSWPIRPLGMEPAMPVWYSFRLAKSSDSFALHVRPQTLSGGTVPPLHVERQQRGSCSLGALIVPHSGVKTSLAVSSTGPSLLTPDLPTQKSSKAWVHPFRAPCTAY